MKINRPWVPFLFALGFVTASLVLGFLVDSSAIGMVLYALHFPAGIIVFLILPGETFTKTGSPVVYLSVTFIFAVLQWYLIFAGGLWLRRRLSKSQGAA